MFYELQDKEKQEAYKEMLLIIGNLSLLFSDSPSPYLPYRCHENIFCKYFEAENIGRKDCSADAQKGIFGIGLKTWVGSDNQKVAEFNKLRTAFSSLSGLDLVKKIAEFRNERIRVTKNMYGIETMLYHIVKRVPGKMEICEHDFDYIDIDNITLLPERDNDNNIYFTDGNHTYHFSLSKNTLYMIFENLVILDAFDVEIMSDPYDYLLNIKKTATYTEIEEACQLEPVKEQLCLRLYSVNKSGKFVAQKSGLNQWNASGRKRHPNEIYIPFPVEDRNRKTNFFPPRDTPFNLRLPDGTIISAKVCQDQGKAIMSNPNKDLGEWLLRKVFEIPENTIVTYEMLEKYNVDSVVFTKNAELDYSVDFSEIGTYEQFYNLEENE